MTEEKREGINYGNWVSARIILLPTALTLVCTLLSLLSRFLLIPAGVFLLISAYFVYARYLFSRAGGNLQEKTRALVLEHLRWDGRGHALDIGCGNAALTIELAKKFPNCTVVGIDSWGASWGYSERLCLANTKQERVADRVTFKKASASSLPFNDGEFDAVVSNVVFHEVKDSSNKVGLIKEALRVLKKGGKFTFQDLFGIQQLYGKPEGLVKTIEDWGINRVEYIDTSNSSFIPTALKLPFMLGTLGLLTGEK